jgi:hypothetical protein
LMLFSKAQCIGFTNQYRSNFYDKLAEVHTTPKLALSNSHIFIGRLFVAWCRTEVPGTWTQPIFTMIAALAK